MFGALLRWAGRRAGWRIVGRLPDLDKYVIIGAPHTSNWDFVLFVWARAELRLTFGFIGKHTIFWWPLGILWRRMGGIPVERGARMNVVDQVAERFRTSGRLILAMSPEGTRKYTRAWRSGFYHIALKAGVPVVPGGLDYPSRTVTIGSPRMMTGDVQRDLASFREFFATSRGYRPEQAGSIELEGTEPAEGSGGAQGGESRG
ncbi:MAG: 1-acyl-sn-glycerol-3-phosphate acyltransferase [Gemmatimonadetes bacterium]|nr:1-acyl-sn-glycerol-3-phosphate acyltransferase [Gemmatimonadota bacterium]